MDFLIRQIISFFRRPRVRFGFMTDAVRGRRTSVRNAQFVGFLEGSGFRRVSVDRHEKALHRRRTAVNIVVTLLFLGFVWVMIESAHALSLF
jgi:hypothetical protein